MIRTTAVPRPVRAGAAVFGVLGIVTLAGCAGTTPEAEAPAGGSSTAPSASSGSATSEPGGSGSYADGTYSAKGSYATPESVETVDVTVTLENSVITAVEVVGDPQAAESRHYQSEFIGGISAEVEGKNIDDISVSRVAGSSLTSGGFNEAIEAIKSEAAA